MPRTAPLPGISARPAALDGGFRADRVSRRLSRPFRPSFHLQFYLIDRRGMPHAAQLLLAMGPVWWTATAGLPFGVPGLQLGGLSTKTGVARRAGPQTGTVQPARALGCAIYRRYPARLNGPLSIFCLGEFWQPIQDGGEGRTRTFEAIRRLIYSQLPLPLGTLPRPNSARPPALGGDGQVVK